MVSLRTTVLFLGLCSALTVDAREATGANHRANPIRRVVDLLQQMQTQVTEEGKAEKALFEKFMCWCKSGGDDLKLAISSAETKIPQVTASLKESEALHARLGAELAQHKADRQDAKDALAKATALR